jgi:hypothetical protein
MARLADIVFDCDRPAALARFWAAALDGYAIAPYDDEEIARLRAMGVDDIEDDPSVMLLGPGPRLFCQRVPEPKSAKNRCHLDLACDDVGAEVARLVALGAVRLTDQPTDGTVALADPAGNELCVRGS